MVNSASAAARSSQLPEIGVGAGNAGTEVEDLPPWAVVAHSILFPSQHLHCSCLKGGFWDRESLFQLF